MMRKIFFVILSFFCFLVSAASLPESLEGIWEGKDRFVFFENNGEDENQIVILLKEYYGWYYDRAAEPASYAETESRTRNAATAKKAESIYFTLKEQKKNPNKNDEEENLQKNAWELTFEYSKYQKNIIPLCVIDNCIYLNYYIQDSKDKNYYRGNAVSRGITLDSQIQRENISCLYFTDDSEVFLSADSLEDEAGGKKYFFDIRYWNTDMEYSFENSSLSYGEKTYFVDRHIFSCGNNYSATSGRSRVIRNVMPPVEFNEDDFVLSEDESLMAVSSSQYLVKLADKNTVESLMLLVNAQNSKRKPPAPPPFEPSNLDWHWDLIDELEKNNEIILEVRKRQKEFGLRGKDFGR